ncbi:MAG: [NiFe]-hydrogenase assembly chaperone HybE [Candidatus Thiodiazotropha sp. (ex Lucinoma kastoroae)]|nr:[NiFe]-hydrogenase assembly chaperone HybE [Candidatus Thiodiazotropha sp. (ex Rostrolucina anterorostrata)]MCU7847089.1 [NiFe]-hydrogenase assembly chaperone HybE [Candidatus Thiodiazotropha sp. (ex Lucinoma kastoroae)]
MQDLQQLTHQIEASFTHIHEQQMQGIPLLNPLLVVQTIGFQHYQGRCVGIIITPWMMNLIMFPAENENWDELELGHKQPHRFPANQFKFMVNEVDGIGKCQTYSLHSPMHEFAHQDHAVAAAMSFMQTLMVAVEHPDEDPYDEELLGRILRGEEETEVAIDGFALTVEQTDTQGLSDAGLNPSAALSISRRDLLRGGYKRET